MGDLLGVAGLKYLLLLCLSNSKLKIVSATRRGYRLCLHQLQCCYIENTACSPVADTVFSVGVNCVL